MRVMPPRVSCRLSRQKGVMTLYIICDYFHNKRLSMCMFHSVTACCVARGDKKK